MLLVKFAERLVLEVLSGQLVIVFDGWMVASTHYSAVFATLTFDGAIECKQRLQRFSLLEEKRHRTPKNFFLNVFYMLEVHD